MRAFKQKIEALDNDEYDADEDTELRELFAENNKLKHRLAILNKVQSGFAQNNLILMMTGGFELNNILSTFAGHRQ